MESKWRPEPRSQTGLKEGSSRRLCWFVPGLFRQPLGYLDFFSVALDGGRVAWCSDIWKLL